MQIPIAPMPQPPRRAPPEDVWEALRDQDLEEKMGQGTAHGETTKLFAR